MPDEMICRRRESNLGLLHSTGGVSWKVETSVTKWADNAGTQMSHDWPTCLLRDKLSIP